MKEILRRRQRLLPFGGQSDQTERVVPDNLWISCKKCKELIYAKEFEDNAKVCTKCSYHSPLSPMERIALLCDEGSFVEMDADLTSPDPLGFRTDDMIYTEKLASETAKAGTTEAMISGTARIDGQPMVVAVHNFSFMGGSMGVVVGEKVARAIETAIALHAPLLIVTATGGARMQEGIFGLMQMAKSTAALTRLRATGVPYLTLLTDPTVGGVPASYAMLGDVTLAEPGAFIGFAGPRVIEQATRMKLPSGVDTSEFMQAHGMVDLVVQRTELRATLSRLLRLLCGGAYQPDQQKTPSLSNLAATTSHSGDDHHGGNGHTGSPRRVQGWWEDRAAKQGNPKEQVTSDAGSGRN